MLVRLPTVGGRGFTSFMALTATVAISGGTALAEPAKIARDKVYGIFSTDEIAALLPETSERGIGDLNILTRPRIGVRFVRLYADSPMHYHSGSDTIVYVLRDQLSYQIADADPVDVGPGDILYWAAGIPHGNPEVNGTADLLVFDTPPRDPSDLVWSDPRDARPFLE